MKPFKTLFFVSLFLAGFISCEQNNSGGQDNTPPFVDVPDNIIPVDQADQWYKNYGTDRAPIIEEGVNAQYPNLVIPYQTTRFVTADYATLKQYLDFIDQESKEAGVTPKGLRIYFAATNASTKGGPGRETVYFNPVTSFDAINGDISYAIATDASGKKTAVTVGSVIDGKKPRGTNLLLQGGGIQSLAGDDLGWPPPPYPNDPNDYH